MLRMSACCTSAALLYEHLRWLVKDESSGTGINLKQPEIHIHITESGVQYCWAELMWRWHR